MDISLPASMGAGRADSRAGTADAAHAPRIGAWTVLLGTAITTAPGEKGSKAANAWLMSSKLHSTLCEFASIASGQAWKHVSPSAPAGNQLDEMNLAFRH